MPFLKLRDSQFPLFVGETRIGRGMGADVRLPGTEDEATLLAALIIVADDHSASIRHVGDEYDVEVNGVALGDAPQPLSHGDRIDVVGLELFYADEQMGAITAQTMAPIVRSSTPMPSSGEPATAGGRIVSLVDGREYRIEDAGTTIGREAGCDVVVAAHDVSRRHARLEMGSSGYVVVDTSTNGVLVNGVRITGRQTLGRGDIIKVGPEEFRFSADSGATSAPMPPSISLPPPPVSAPGPSEAAAPAPAPRARARPALATFEVINEGPTKGTLYELIAPLSHVGRGEHNDVVISDESVSDSHAKVQRRESGWFIVDIDSTNGTYVGGQRVQGEAPLVGNVDVRFGGVKLLFRPAGGAGDAPQGTRVIVGLKGPEPRRLSDLPPERPKAPPLPEGPVRVGVPRWLVAAIILLVLALLYLIGLGG